MKPTPLILAAILLAGCSKEPSAPIDPTNYVVINYEFESLAGRGQGHFRTTFVGDYTPDSILTNQLPDWIGEISAAIGTDVLRIVLCQVNHHRIIEP